MKITYIPGLYELTHRDTRIEATRVNLTSREVAALAKKHAELGYTSFQLIERAPA